MNETDNSMHFKLSQEDKFRFESYQERIQSIVQHRGGICFSNKIETQNQKLLWQCADGHRWMASATSILYSKSWCPVYAGNRTLTIDEMNEIAKSRGGRCLSKTYTNSKTKLRWQCADSHVWWATPFSIKNRHSWCPICYKVIKNN